MFILTAYQHARSHEVTHSTSNQTDFSFRLDVAIKLIVMIFLLIIPHLVSVLFSNSIFGSSLLLDLCSYTPFMHIYSLYMLT